MAASEKVSGFAPVFGIPTGITSPSGTQILSASFDQSFALDQNVKDDEGVIIHERLDDIRTALSVELMEAASGFTAPTVGTGYGLRGITFLVRSVGRPETAGDFVRYSLSGENLAGITTYAT
jgi:hypothetical protein